MNKFALIGILGLLACSSTQEGPLVPDGRLPDANVIVLVDASVNATTADARLADGPLTTTDAPKLVDAGLTDAQTKDGPDATPRDGGPDGGTVDAGVADANTNLADASGPLDGCMPTAAVELCGNNVDDNCNGKTDEGFEKLGTECTAGMGACMRTGAWICTPDKTALACTAKAADPGPIELCGNGIDDDCDGSTDEGFEAIGTACSVGMGACMRTGVWACTADRTQASCSATPGIPAENELCGNNLDDDCDGATDEGFEHVGEACDGPDNDLCAEGHIVCSGDRLSTICDDTTGNAVELCNGVDDDCNPATPDGADEQIIRIPTLCDAQSDSDTCVEGYYQCTGGQFTCSDPGNDNLFDDPDNCGGCDHICGGTNVVNRACTNAQCNPICGFGFQSCDGNLDNGCETSRLNSQTCSNPINLGAIDGNSNDGESTTSYSAFTAAWYVVRVDEDNLIGDLNARIQLTNPPNVRFGLVARCFDCNSVQALTVAPPQNGTGSVVLGRSDHVGSEDAFYVLIQVYYLSGDRSSCGNYQLYVTGTEETSRTCDN